MPRPTRRARGRIGNIGRWVLSARMPAGCRFTRPRLIVAARAKDRRRRWRLSTGKGRTARSLRAGRDWTGRAFDCFSARVTNALSPRRRFENSHGMSLTDEVRGARSVEARLRCSGTTGTLACGPCSRRRSHQNPPDSLAIWLGAARVTPRATGPELARPVIWTSVGVRYSQVVRVAGGSAAQGDQARWPGRILTLNSGEVPCFIGDFLLHRHLAAFIITAAIAAPAFADDPRRRPRACVRRGSRHSHRQFRAYRRTLLPRRAARRAGSCRPGQAGCRDRDRLDHGDGDSREQQLAEAAGMKFVKIAMSTRVVPTEEQMKTFLSIVNDPRTSRSTCAASAANTAPA